MIAASFVMFFQHMADMDAQTPQLDSSLFKIQSPIKAIAVPDTLTLCIVGDIMMHSAQIETAGGEGATKTNGGSVAYETNSTTRNNYDFNGYFTHLQEYFQKADYVIGNMEFTLAGEPYTGYPCFSAPDGFETYLTNAGFDIFLTANNHICDKGRDGAIRTYSTYLKMQEDGKIAFTGISSNTRPGNKSSHHTEDQLNNNNNPLIINKYGLKLALINATYGTNLTIDSKDFKVNYLNDTENMSKMFKAAKDSSAHFTILLPHWGEEYKLIRNENQLAYAKKYAKMGADLIIGAHPHVIQNIDTLEIDNRKIEVAYSIGNAVSNMSATNTQLGLMAIIRIVKNDNGSARLLPIEYKYLWCSRPGGYNNSYTVLPVTDFIGRKSEWKNHHDYYKMIHTFENVKNTVKIEEVKLDK